MATHSSILAWRIPWTEESGRLSSRGRKESDTTERLSTHQKATRSQVGREETPRVRGRGGDREELPRVRGQWQSGRPGEATSRLRPGVVTLRSHPKPEARGGTWEEPPMPEARAGGLEEQPQKRWLRRHRSA